MDMARFPRNVSCLERVQLWPDGILDVGAMVEEEFHTAEVSSLAGNHEWSLCVAIHRNQ